MGKKVKLKVGDKAPLIKAESYNAGQVDLDNLIGKQKIILIFSRYFGCPICQLDAKTLMEGLPQIESKGAVVLYVTQSSKEKANEFIEKENMRFPVIPGELIPGTKNKYTLYSDYGLGKMTGGAAAKVLGKLRAAKKAGIKHGEYEGYETQCPGQFVIDLDGKLIHAKKNWLDLESILAVL